MAHHTQPRHLAVVSASGRLQRVPRRRVASEVVHNAPGQSVIGCGAHPPTYVPKAVLAPPTNWLRLVVVAAALDGPDLPGGKRAAGPSRRVVLKSPLPVFLHAYGPCASAENYPTNRREDGQWSHRAINRPTLHAPSLGAYSHVLSSLLLSSGSQSPSRLPTLPLPEQRASRSSCTRPLCLRQADRSTVN